MKNRSGGGIRRSRVVVTAAVVLLAIGVVMADPSSNVQVNKETSDNASTELKIEITGCDGGETRFKDLHLRAENEPPTNPPQKLYPVNVTTVDVMKKQEDGSYKKVGEFKVEKTKDGTVHLTAKSPPDGLADGEYSITIPWTGTPTAPKWGFAKVSVTKNGEISFGPGDLIGPEHTPKEAYVPVTYVALFGDPPGADPVTFALGAVNPLTVTADDELGGLGYRIHSSLSENPTHEDELGIGINSETDPVPPEWGLAFTGFEGLLTPEGGTAEPVTVLVPPDPMLAGRTIYFVVEVRNAEGETIVVSEVLSAVLGQP